MQDEIEVLDENENLIDINSILNTDKKEEVIELDRLFDEDFEEVVVDAYEEDLKNEKIRQNKITKIQIGLIIFLIVSASLIYFFGYDLVEPLIKID